MTGRFRRIAGAGLWAGPAAAVLVGLALPSDALPPEGRIVAATAALMAVWWVTEALPLAMTALVPVAVLPVAGASPLERVAAAYADPLIFLFLGGFLIARAVEESGLHRRIAVRILGLAGRSPAGVIAAMMAATAFLSLWVSNTAAAMVMAPIAASLAAARPGGSTAGSGFSPALMLGTAYAATIGGMGSIIGTPPNALFAAYMREAHGVEIGFAAWMAVGLPAVLVLLPLAWLVLTRLCFRIGSGPMPLLPDAGIPMSPHERRVGAVAVAAACGWVLRPALERLLPGVALSDAGIAAIAAIALFIIPSGTGGRLLAWDEAARLRWDVLILVGGGLALAAAISESGVAARIGSASGALAGLPMPVLVVATALVIVGLGELASNTAMAAIFLPLAGAAAAGLGHDPVAFALPVALAASIGFMLPVATPPNAIVFNHPSVTGARMLGAGAPLDLIGVAVAVAAGMLLGPLVF